MVCGSHCFCEPILLRCGKCNHVLCRNERVNDNQCCQCGAWFCFKCGTNEKPHIFPYGWNGDEYSCSVCKVALS